jgi:hypothetical protein
MLGWFRRYVANDDPLVEAAGTIALLVAANQPFYPLYLRLFVAEDVWLSLLTLLSTPLFLVVPAVSRRHPLAGRALLPLAGVANTLLCAKLFGAASGVELFLAPCLMIAAMLFRRSERAAMLVVVALVLLPVLVPGAYGAPVQPLAPEAYASLLRLNALSAAGLMVFAGLTFADAVARLERPR